MARSEKPSFEVSKIIQQRQIKITNPLITQQKDFTTEKLNFVNKQLVVYIVETSLKFSHFTMQFQIEIIPPAIISTLFAF